MTPHFLRRLPALHQAVAALVLVCLLGSPVALAADKGEEPAVPNSEIRGKVLGADGKPAAGVEVYAYHLATEELFTTTTNGKGEYALQQLPYGYFDLAAKGPEGLFVSDQVANVSPTGKNSVDFRMQSFSAATQADRRAFPGLDEAPVGVARVVDQKMVGESFWSSPKGISIISGGGALVLLAIAGGSDSEPAASPFVP